MGFFSKAQNNAAWLALVPQRDGIAAASVRRGADAGARPAVTHAVFFPGTASADAVEKAGKELHSANYRCTTVLSGGDYQFMSVESPNVPRDELKAAMRWRLKDILDFPADQATIDVLDIPPDPNAASRQRNMFVVAARNSVVQERQKLFAGAKLSLSVIDIPEMAQRNIAAMIEPEGRGLAMLSFDEDSALLTVTYGGELYLSRRIEMPLASLVDADHDRRHQAFDRITLELQRSLDNFERQYSFISVSKLVLGPNEVAGLDEYLSSNLYTPVDTLDLANLFDLERVPELAAKAMQQRYFVTLGAALREEKAA
jgi:MSHA biogenesis protein MshI